MRQPLRACLQLLRRIGRLLGQRGVLPGHFVELRDDLVDVGNALPLLLADAAECADGLGDLLHVGRDALHRLHGLLHGVRALVDLAVAARDQFADLARWGRDCVLNAFSFLRHSGSFWHRSMGEGIPVRYTVRLRASGGFLAK